MRIILLLLVFIAFFEPSFQFERVDSLRNNIPVLVDASLSMSLFNPESTIIPFLRKLQQANSTAGNQSRKFEFFLFGDSLRVMGNSEHLRFSDNQSNIPLHYSKNISSARDLIIVSDANWSNSFLMDAFAEKSIHYLQLPGFKSAPFLRIISSEISSSPSDSPATAILTFEGRIDKQIPVEINITEAGRLISRQSFNENPGNFKHTVKINLPSATPGKHLYRFSASHGDSLRTFAYDIRYARPQNFNYQLYSLSPSLDQRFITLALSKHPEFKKIETIKNKNDCVFFFSWNDTIKNHLEDIKQNGIAVFIGCLPCSESHVTPSVFSLFRMKQGLSGAIDNLALEKLPPPSQVINCSNLLVKSPLLSMHNQEGLKKDTLHLLFNTEWQGHQILALTVKDFWRWDFWPMSMEYSEEQSFSFSELFITTLTEQLLSSISEQYYIYPTYPTAESDLLFFSVSFPSTMPVACKSDISFTIKNSHQKTVIDTSVEIINTGSLKSKIAIRRLPADTYSFTSTISGNQKKYSFSDTLFIEDRKSELHIPGQNSLLLSEIGQPINLNDIDALIIDLINNNSRNEQIIKDSYHLNRTWILLACILILLGSEWMYRKLIGLD